MHLAHKASNITIIVVVFGAVAAVAVIEKKPKIPQLKRILGGQFACVKLWRNKDVAYTRAHTHARMHRTA